MERIKDWSLDAFNGLLSKGYDLELKNGQNLDILRDKPNCPAIIYFNHTITDDPLIIFQLVHGVVPERMDNVIVPVSEKHSKFKNFPAYSLLVGLGNGLWGIKTPEVVQSYRLRTGAEGGEDLLNKSSQLGKKLFRLIDASLPSGPLIMLSPEGHRSEGGWLLPAEGGVGAIAQLMDRQIIRGKLDDGLFIPIGIKVEDFRGKAVYYNPINKPSISCTIGDPISCKEAVSYGDSTTRLTRPDPKVISHYLMSQVARLLPEEMQGVYHPDLINDTFQGRFEQRSDSFGKVYIYDYQTQGPFQYNNS